MRGRLILHLAYYQLPDDICASLVGFALSVAPEIRKQVLTAEKQQRWAKLTTREMLRKRKLVAAQCEYENALPYLDVYHSSVCWRDVTTCKVSCRISLPNKGQMYKRQHFLQKNLYLGSNDRY